MLCRLELTLFYPYGYRVSIKGSWAEFPSTTWTDGDIKGGAVWQSTWWPATGFRNANSADMIAVTYQAYYWSSSFYSSATDYRSYNLYFNYSGSINPGHAGYRSAGYSLRCVQE